MRETWVWSLGREDPLEKEMAIHSSTNAWKIPCTEEPGRLQSMGSQRVRHDWATSLSLFPPKLLLKQTIVKKVRFFHFKTSHIIISIRRVETITVDPWSIYSWPFFSLHSQIQPTGNRESGSIPRLGRFPGGGNGNPLHYSCLENSMDRGVWWAAVHGIRKSQTWLRDKHTRASK